MKRLLQDRIDPEQLLHCSEMLKALAHPIRLGILDLLENGARLSVTEIHNQLGLEQAVVSHHLSIMRNRGLLNSTRLGKNTFYAIANAELTTVLNCVERCAAK